MHFALCHLTRSDNKDILLYHLLLAETVGCRSHAQWWRVAYTAGRVQQKCLLRESAMYISLHRFIYVSS